MAFKSKHFGCGRVKFSYDSSFGKMKCLTDNGSNHIRITHTHSLQVTNLCYLNYCNTVYIKMIFFFFLIILLEVQKQCWPCKTTVSVRIRGNLHLSLHKSDESLNELDERLLTFMACLGAWCGWFGLGGGEDTAGRRRWRAPAEVAGKA